MPKMGTGSKSHLWLQHRLKGEYLAKIFKVLIDLDQSQFHAYSAFLSYLFSTFFDLSLLLWPKLKFKGEWANSGCYHVV